MTCQFAVCSRDATARPSAKTLTASETLPIQICTRIAYEAKVACRRILVVRFETWIWSKSLTRRPPWLTWTLKHAAEPTPSSSGAIPSTSSPWQSSDPNSAARRRTRRGPRRHSPLVPAERVHPAADAGRGVPTRVRERAMTEDRLVPSTDPSHACPECGVVPSRFIDGDHEEGCSRQPICPECGCDPTTMFHGINGCTLASGRAAQS